MFRKYAVTSSFPPRDRNDTVP